MQISEQKASLRASASLCGWMGPLCSEQMSVKSRRALTSYCELQDEKRCLNAISDKTSQREAE